MNGESEPRPGVALVIGVGEYRHGGMAPLRFAVADADALAELLTDPDVCAFPADHVALLTDADAHRDAIVYRLSEWLPQRARGAELVVIYFAGHGTVRTVGRKEEGFLLPHDADPDNPVARGVAMGDLSRWIEGLEATAVVVCLDCCHAGMALTRGPEPAPARELALRPGVLREVAGKGRFLLASCDEGQRSVEDPALGHGLFTYHLLKGIAGEGDRDGDGRVGVAELFEYVSQAVVRDARKHGVEQKPWTAAVAAGGVYISAPRARPAHSFERIRQVDGPEAAVREIGRRMAGADEPALVELLKQAGRAAHPLAVPLVVPHLAHPTSEAVRVAAKRAVQAIGIERTFAAVEDLARKGDAALGPVLHGLGAFEARADLIRLLDRLVDLQSGPLLTQAVALLDRKRLGLGLETVAGLFRANHSQYELEKALGLGLFAAAYLARDAEAEMQVVVRVLREEFVQLPEIRKQFLEVCKRSIKFGHQNLVRTLEVRAFPDQRVYYTVRAFVEGVTLRDVLAGGRRFEPLQVVEIVRQLLGALDPLHRAGVCHGGVKPSNVFVCPRDLVVLGDLVPAVLPPTTGPDPRVAYNHRYTSPEVFRGEPAGPLADLYAVGCVAFELFCGEPPFASDRAHELMIRHLTGPVPLARSHRPELPAAVDAFVSRLLAKEPANRPAGAEAALADLETLREELRRPPRPTPTAPDQTVARPAPAPPVPLVAEASLVRYQPADTFMSVGHDRPMTMAGEPVATGPAPAAEASSNVDAPTGGGSRVGAPPGVPSRIGRYEVRAVLGSGAFGRVYRGYDPELQRDVAIKVMHQAGTSPEYRERFLREARAAATIRHPNVIQVYDLGDYEGYPYIAMEYLPGVTLSDRLRDGPLAPRMAAVILAKVGRGLAAVHQHGFVHRDVKPANVLFDEKGEPKITDFGLAKRVSGEELTVDGTVMGTPAYMPPEQVRGEIRAIGPASDVWALGATLYQCLAGRGPFTGASFPMIMFDIVNGRFEPLGKAAPGVPRELEAVCWRCLQTDPQNRYPTAKEFAHDLEAYLRGAAPTSAASVAGSSAAFSLPRGQTKPLELDDDEPAPTEVLVCPKCQARLQAKTGRTAAVRCPRCNSTFAADAGRTGAAPTRAAPPSRRGLPSRGDWAQLPDDSGEHSLGSAAVPQPDARSSESVALPPRPGRFEGRRSWLAALNPLTWFGRWEDPVDCSVFAPPRVPVGSRVLVQVFAHLPGRADEARALAQDYDEQAVPRGLARLEVGVRRGAELAVHMVLPGFEVPEPWQRLIWRGRTDSVAFEVRVPAGLSPGTHIGTARVCLNRAPVGHIKFKLEVTATTTAPAPRPEPIGFDARRYERVFVSYATENRAEVLKRVQMLRLLRVQVFQDVLDLEPGARWERELFRHIDTADLFLLFWSSAARQSEWVRRELCYALERKAGKEHAPPEILPVVIEGPPPPDPPDELRGCHFNDPVLYFMAPGRG
jgi:serine/threonine protein kinase/uncharacterized caspase-like protein